jgi:hypothetical protein
MHSHSHHDADAEEEDHHHHDGKNWFEFLVIDEENSVYIVFNMLITILCLVSVYYYGSMAGFRYSDESVQDLRITFTIEAIFFLHMVLQFFVNTKKLDDSNSK